MSAPGIRDLDPRLVEIFDASGDLYNRETKLLESLDESSASINATHFLARHTIMFAQAALHLMEDARLPLVPAAALLRTCLEAQARANHIVAVSGAERETRANEFNEFLTVGNDYYEGLVAQWYNNFGSDVPKALSDEKAILDAIQASAKEVDTSKLKALKARYRNLSKNWSYPTVIGLDKLTDLNWQKRTGPQEIQPSLYLRYVKYCYFVHGDPTSLRFERKLSPLVEAHSAVLATVSALISFMTTLEKLADADLQKIRKAILAFPLVERILQERAAARAQGGRSGGDVKR